MVDNSYFQDVRVTREVKILAKQHEVFVLCVSGGSKDNDSVTQVSIPSALKNLLFGTMTWLPLYNYLWRRWIDRFVEFRNVDVLHVHDLYMAKSAGHVARKNKIPLILDLHENFPVAINSYNWVKSPFKRFISRPEKWYQLEGDYLSFADRLIVLSDYFKNKLLEKYRFLKEDYIYTFENVVDFDFFDRLELCTKSYINDKPVLFYFGGVAERRGIFDTLMVMEKLLQEGIDLELLIIGPIDKADKNRFLRWIQKPILRDFVTYISWISMEELPSYIQKADICLAPFHKNEQHDSGVANKIFQYMYFSKPIVASDCYSQKVLIEAANCGYIFSDYEDYFKQLKISLSRPNERVNKGQNGRRYLKENYQFSNQEISLLAVYEKLI